MKGYMYILECSDGSYYTGSSIDLVRRLKQHQNGEGANHTKKHLPVKLLYYEEFNRIDKAFYREKQVQGWSRKKKEALIRNMPDDLKKLSECMNESHCKNYVPFDFAQGTEPGAQGTEPGAQGTEPGAQGTEPGAQGTEPSYSGIAPVVERSRNHH